jgi:hypothetical protein
MEGTTQPTTELALKTFYVSETTLRHELYTISGAFNQVTMNWSENLMLSVVANNGSEIRLTIRSVEFAPQNTYTLVIYTNNPLDSISSKSFMPFARRLLESSIDLKNYKTGLQMTETAAQLLLPNYLQGGQLSVDYPLDSPEFYQSYVQVTASSFPFYIIGATIMGILFLKYLLKAVMTVPLSPNLGNIVPHIEAFKVGALLLYPTYL